MGTQQQFLRELLDASKMAALLVAPDGAVVSSNPAADALFGYPQGDLDGQPLEGLGLPESIPGDSAWSCSCTTRTGAVLHATATVLPFQLGKKRFLLYMIRPDSRVRHSALEREFQGAVLRISQSPEIASGDFDAAARVIVARVANSMDVERVGLWLLEDEASIMVCVAQYQRSSDEHSRGAVLRASDYPAYFRALESGRAIAADDAVTDPATREFAHGYLDVNGISSMLDSVIRVSGEIIGVVCHEHVGAPRKWRDEEIVFAGEVADQAAHAYLVTKNIEAEVEGARLKAELLQAQKFDAIGRLAGGVAHDFNNMLSVVLGYVEIGLGKNPPASVVSCLGEIRAAGERAASLTSQLLSIGRQQVLQKSNLDLNELVKRILELLGRVMREDIRIEFRPDPRPLIVHADPSQLKQIVMNLCINARDALPGGGCITITTRMESGSNGNPMVVLAVRDDGVGIEPEVADRIFEPFFSTKAEGAGTGLGLSTVYGVARQHGGRVDVKSAPGQGALFEVHLPQAHDNEGQKKPEVVAIENPLRGNGEHVLVAEDSDQIRPMVRMILEEAGYRVTLAVDGEDAIRKFESLEGDVDLVLMDVVMPKKSGPETLQAIRANNPRVAAVFSTGYGADVLSATSVDGPSIDVVAKPYDLQTLLLAIQRALKAVEA